MFRGVADFMLKILNILLLKVMSVTYRARDLKNSGKYGSGLSGRWALFTA